ncbi:hypothetical protein BOTBODRAFT_45495 [Botryobasidium botryosum FD-172 SS1]|uniref:Uncharacterized protein n=1 Tax=Botryobasidium botryosum (strain FD-172 SS1) TaxID=930990 RepID=A0A067MEH3_BOTB1|nr:hypothetical protein BOTBODRAFT_45495 [Botryobasidium botryosum FD-172 SS1]
MDSGIVFGGMLVVDLVMTGTSLPATSHAATCPLGQPTLDLIRMRADETFAMVTANEGQDRLESAMARLPIRRASIGIGGEVYHFSHYKVIFVVLPAHAPAQISRGDQSHRKAAPRVLPLLIPAKTLFCNYFCPRAQLAAKHLGVPSSACLINQLFWPDWPMRLAPDNLASSSKRRGIPRTTGLGPGDKRWARAPSATHLSRHVYGGLTTLRNHRWDITLALHTAEKSPATLALPVGRCAREDQADRRRT